MVIGKDHHERLAGNTARGRVLHVREVDEQRERERETVGAVREVQPMAIEGETRVGPTTGTGGTHPLSTLTSLLSPLLTQSSQSLHCNTFSLYFLYAFFTPHSLSSLLSSC